MKKSLSILIACLVIIGLVLTGCGGGGNQQSQDSKPEGEASDKTYTIANIPKQMGEQWFVRMDEGNKKFADDTGHNVFQTGASKADAALQVQAIEDVIAQNVDVITVVPNSPEALEPVLKKAMDSGIVVISHEASNQENIHYDVEAFDNHEYGAHFMDNLAKLMGEEGEYAIFVGGLTAKTHMEWAEGAIARQKEKYPNMKLATDIVEADEDQQVAYQKTKELLKAYPNLKGIIGCSSADPAGAGLAVEEAGLQDKVNVVGTSLVSICGRYLETGAVKSISFWDPADAAYAMHQVALKVLEGKEIKDGDDLGVPGYNDVKVKGKVIYGSAWVDVTKDNMAEYDF